MTEKTVTIPLEGVDVRRRGDMCDLGIVGKGHLIVVELTLGQITELAKILRRVRKEILHDA